MTAFLEQVDPLDGRIVAIARGVLLVAYILLAAGAMIHADAVELLSAIAIACVLLLSMGWRGLLALLVAPDWPLWHPPAGWGVLRRIALTVVLHLVLALILVAATLSSVRHPTPLMLLPLLGSLFQRMVNECRESDSPSGPLTRSRE